MSTPNALDGFARELVQRGLPADYALCTAAELEDHYGDLVTEQLSAGLDESDAHAEACRRLGDTRTLARKAAREFQRRHWCGRWPLVSFVLAPIPALCLVWSAMAAAAAGVESLCELFGYELTTVDGKTSLFERGLVEVMWGLTFLLGPALVAALFARLARRSGLAPAWVVVVGVQLALFLGLTQFNVDYQRCTLQLGWPIEMPSFASWMVWYFGGTWRHSLQVAIPLLLGLLMVAGQIAERRRAADIIAC